MIMRASRAIALWFLLLAVATPVLAYTPTLDTFPRIHFGDVGDLVTFEFVYSGGLYSAGFYDVVFDSSQLEPVAIEQQQYDFQQFLPPTRKQDGRILTMRVVTLGGELASGPIGSVTFRQIRAGASSVRPVPSLEGHEWSAHLGPFGQPDYTGSLVVAPGFGYPRLERVAPVAFESIAPFQTGFATVRFSNTGTASLSMISTEVLPDSPYYPWEDVHIVDDQCSGRAVPAGGECGVTLVFSPQQFATRTEARARLRLVSDDLVLPELDVLIRAPIKTPRLKIDAISFFNARQMPPYQRQTRRVVNDGEWRASTGRFRLQGRRGSEPRPLPSNAFKITHENCSYRIIDVGEYCEFEVEFRPPFDGRFVDELQLNYDIFLAREWMFGFTPTGLGVVQYDGPQETTLSLGQVGMRTVTITNKSAIPLTIEEDQPPADSSGFTVTFSDCRSRVLEHGEFCSVVLRIAPVGLGSHYWSAQFDTDSLYARPRMWLTLDGVAP